MGAREDCEAALAAHWSQLGHLPGGTLHEDDGLRWFETPVRHLPFNGVVRIRLGPEDADRAIANVMDRVKERGADCWWLVDASSTPPDLGDRLAAAGLQPVERMHFMFLELGDWQPPPVKPGVTYEVAADEAAQRAYTDLTQLYWEIPPEEQAAVAELHRSIGPLPGVRWLARIDGEPIGKAYLSFAGPPGVAAIYGMSVRAQARGRGVAVGLTAVMMERAQELGCRRAVLHATEMAVGVYERIGFSHCGHATVYATAPVWSDE